MATEGNSATDNVVKVTSLQLFGKEYFSYIGESIKQSEENLFGYFPPVACLLIAVLSLYFQLNQDFDDTIYDGRNYFAVTAVGARVVVLVSSLILFISSIASGVVTMFAKNTEASSYKKLERMYRENYLHSTLSVFIISAWFIFLALPETGATEKVADRGEPGWSLAVSAVLAMLLKLFYDIKHAIVVKNYALKTDSEKEFTVSRSMGGILSVMLVIYFIVAFAAKLDLSDPDYGETGSLLLAILLGIYTLLLNIETKASGETREGGFLYLGVPASQMLLHITFYFAAWFLSHNKEKEALFVVLMILYLDGLQVGIPNKGKLVADEETQGLGAGLFFLYRLVQFGLGLLAIIAITPTSSDKSIKLSTADVNATAPSASRAHLTGHVEALTTVIWGIGLASGVVKVLQSVFMDEIVSPSPAQTFRKFSSTGLIIASTYLWIGGAGFEGPDDLSTAFSTTLFSLALANRILDSWFDSAVDDNTVSEGLGKQFAAFAYIRKDESDEASLNKPSWDNVRSWMVLLGLCVSAVMLLNWSTFDEVIFGVSEDATLQSNYFTTALVLIFIHIAAVVLALLTANADPPFIYAGLSRSSALRLVVSTTVICSLIILSGQEKNIVMAQDLKSGDNKEGHLLGALVAYLFADALGAEFL